MKLVSHYRDNIDLRKSFIQLAADTFGLDFTNWHEKGYWGERYIPFSYADGSRVVANVSVNELDLIIDGTSRKGLQIGTVMTHPEYRHKGLSACLMNHVLAEYEGMYDYMYLFANDSVLDFYPKFGFERVEEHQFSTRVPSNTGRAGLRKLEIPADLKQIEKMVYGRAPVSRAFATGNSGGITMYHILNVFPDHLYYSEDEDAIVIFTEENGRVQLYDVIGSSRVNITNILPAGEVVFHYTPDYKDLDFRSLPFKREGALFVKNGIGREFPRFVKHPLTSEA
ncbi:GNAT family N-acetyltransferase [Bacillus sp. ISL-35]|uniref:GNAT family N-acetyltransferase n=1 Tax=Bacillus sp. ISL-35 TaxID=2819122 RepID=UPI001BE9F037|nr:GNAT family N-acetyltransferase [Bacillus sp. ISL-35]MBT2681288.1 GNAT family N-acetyltransferase [Bacillus sp. ISL-35]MBT2705506.1 GNAT family N-acetyltransferase [Chryseobacterium sp. ISL-80]